MKLSRKVLPALAMLIVAAVMLTTSSLAWFAMNAEAKASSMNVTLKSDSPYLYIGGREADTVAEIQQGGYTTVEGSVALKAGTSTELSPAAHTLTISGDTALADVENAQNWYTASAESSSSSAIDKDDQNAEVKQSLNEKTDKMNGYVAQYTYYLTMAVGSPDGNNLKLKGNAITVTAADGKNVNALKVILVATSTTSNGTATKVIELKSSVANNSSESAGTWTCESTDILAATVTDAATVRLDVFIYYDGNHPSIYSNNSTKLGGATVEFTLAVNEPTTDTQ